LWDTDEEREIGEKEGWTLGVVFCVAGGGVCRIGREKGSAEFAEAQRAAEETVEC